MVGWHHRLNGHEFEKSPGMMKDKESWRAVVHGVAKSWMQLSNIQLKLEREMAIHSSILAWKIPWTEEPGSPWGLKELDTTEGLSMQ